MRRQAGDVRAGEPHRAGVGFDHSGDQVEQRRLPRAVRADDRDDAAGPDGEIDILQRLDAAIGLAQAAHLEQRRCRVSRSTRHGKFGGNAAA